VTDVNSRRVPQRLSEGCRLLVVQHLPAYHRLASGNFHSRILPAVRAPDIGNVIAPLRRLSGGGCARQEQHACPHQHYPRARHLRPRRFEPLLGQYKVDERDLDSKGTRAERRRFRPRELFRGRRTATDQWRGARCPLRQNFLRGSVGGSAGHKTLRARASGSRQGGAGEFSRPGLLGPLQRGDPALVFVTSERPRGSRVESRRAPWLGADRFEVGVEGRQFEKSDMKCSWQPLLRTRS